MSYFSRITPTGMANQFAAYFQDSVDSCAERVIRYVKNSLFFTGCCSCILGTGGALYAFFNPQQLLQIPTWVLSTLGFGGATIICIITCSGGFCIRTGMILQERNLKALEEGLAQYQNAARNVEGTKNQIEYQQDRLQKLSNKQDISNKKLEQNFQEANQQLLQENQELKKKIDQLTSSLEKFQHSQTKKKKLAEETQRLLSAAPKTYSDQTKDQ